MQTGEARTRSWGLNLRLVMLLVVQAVPLALLALHFADGERRQELERIRDHAMTVARAIAAQQGEGLAAVRSQLALLAAPEERALFGPQCEDRLRDVLRLQRIFYQLAYADRDGRVVCSGQPVKASFNVGDRPYFQRAASQKTFVLGDLVQGRDSDRWTVVAARPVLDTGEDVRGMLLAALDLRWAQERIAHLQLPEASTVSLSDANGRILARTPNPERFVGSRILEADQFRRTVETQSEGFADSAGLDGVARQIAFTRVPGSDLYVRVGVPQNAVDAAARTALTAGLLATLVVLLITALVSWGGAHMLVLAPVRRLTRAAERLGAGDWSVRTGVQHEPHAIGRLAAKLDELASHGQRTSRALRTLSAGNRTLLRERSEPELLEAMCRVAVEKGGYVLAYVAYAQHDGQKSVKPMAHAGAGSGFLEGLTMSWGEGQAAEGPVGRAIRGGTHVILRSVDRGTRFEDLRQAALERGFGSLIALPLRVDAEVVGAFALFAAEEDAFDDTEVALLDEMAADLSFGIQVLRDQERRVSAERVAAHALTHDRLTGFLNRSSCIASLAAAMVEAEHGRQPIAVMVVHIARLQEVFDGFGYGAANRILCEVAERLARIPGLPAEEWAHLPVDDFAIILPRHDAGTAARIAQQALRVFDTPVSVEDALIDVSANVGVSFYPGHGDEADALLRRAAMAAREGERRDAAYYVYGGTADVENRSRIALAADLRGAIERRELCLHYQPKVDFVTGKACGAEALVRWPHAAKGLIPPVQFVPLAEQTGLVRPMTMLIMDLAIREQHGWLKGGDALPVAVNLSARNLYDPRLLEVLEGLLKTWGLPPELIEFEITESALVDDPDTAKQVLMRLRQLGSKIYIDDFGTGYSSLNYLVTLPVHALKIDRSFVLQMSRSKEAHSVVASVVSMAHNLGLRVVAEGVETEQDVAMLRELGCDHAQGYLFGKPMNAADYAAWRAAR